MAIVYGDNLTDAISQPGETDVFTFQGQSGDVVTIRSTNSSGPLTVRLELVGPDREATLALIRDCIARRPT